MLIVCLFVSEPMACDIDRWARGVLPIKKSEQPQQQTVNTKLSVPSPGNSPSLRPRSATASPRSQSRDRESKDRPTSPEKSLPAITLNLPGRSQSAAFWQNVEVKEAKDKAKDKEKEKESERKLSPTAADLPSKSDRVV